jgi:hypothetical protein
MQISIKKNADKPPTMTCTRDNGTSTWFHSPKHGDYFVRHDLLHYSVETVLEYKTAFFGMIAGGRDLDDFGTQEGVRDTREYTTEALWAEQIVGVIQRQLKPIFAELVSVLDTQYADREGRGEPTISEAQYNEIVAVWHRLLTQWEHVLPGDSLELPFPLFS